MFLQNKITETCRKERNTVGNTLGLRLCLAHKKGSNDDNPTAFLTSAMMIHPMLNCVYAK